MKIIIGVYMCYDYVGNELWYCFCEDFGSYDVMIFFTNVDWVE